MLVHAGPLQDRSGDITRRRSEAAPHNNPVSRGFAAHLLVDEHPSSAGQPVFDTLLMRTDSALNTKCLTSDTLRRAAYWKCCWRRATALHAQRCWMTPSHRHRRARNRCSPLHLWHRPWLAGRCSADCSSCASLFVLYVTSAGETTMPMGPSPNWNTRPLENFLQVPQDDTVQPGPAAEEQLFTSPLRLLLAIDGELSARPDGGTVPRGPSETHQHMLGVGAAMAPTERQLRLTELRLDVQRCWEAEAARTGS